MKLASAAKPADRGLMRPESHVSCRRFTWMLKRNIHQSSATPIIFKAEMLKKGFLKKMADSGECLTWLMSDCNSIA